MWISSQALPNPVRQIWHQTMGKQSFLLSFLGVEGIGDCRDGGSAKPSISLCISSPVGENSGGCLCTFWKHSPWPS